MTASRIMTPVLAGRTVSKASVLHTLSRMGEQLALLRKRKVGAATVHSMAVDELDTLLRRARGEVARLI